MVSSDMFAHKLLVSAILLVGYQRHACTSNGVPIYLKR
uniref:Uncharacterized protein n=1 Tax=Anguilla anguilla TaxID=7936 RepID=A0A0E9WLM6_ANGAN